MRSSILITAVLLSASTSFALSTEEAKSGVASQHAAPVAASRESLIAAARAHEERKHEEHKKEKHHGKHHGKHRKHHAKAEAKSTNAPAAQVAVPVPATASKRVQARKLTLQDILHEVESVGEEVLPFASLLIKRNAVDEVKRLDTELTEQLLKYGLRSLKRDLAAQQIQRSVESNTISRRDLSPEIMTELYARSYDDEVEMHDLFARGKFSGLTTALKDAGQFVENHSGVITTAATVAGGLLTSRPSTPAPVAPLAAAAAPGSSEAPAAAAAAAAPAQPQGFLAGIEHDLASIF